MNVKINHYNTSAIKFKALKRHYPTGNYDESYNEVMKRRICWFELYIDGLEITWFADEDYTRSEEE